MKASKPFGQSENSAGQSADNSVGHSADNSVGHSTDNLVGHSTDNSVGQLAAHYCPELIEIGKLGARNFVERVSLAKRIGAVESVSAFCFGDSSQTGFAIRNDERLPGFVTLSSMLPPNSFVNHPNANASQTSFSPIEKFPDTEDRLNNSNMTILPRRKTNFSSEPNSVVST